MSIISVLILISKSKETRHMEWHETCKCKCKLDAIVSNNKQRWNKDKCRCECKELKKAYVIKDCFGILVIVIANVIIIWHRTIFRL